MKLKILQELVIKLPKQAEQNQEWEDSDLERFVKLGYPRSYFKNIHVSKERVEKAFLIVGENKNRIARGLKPLSEKKLEALEEKKRQEFIKKEIKKLEKSEKKLIK